MSENPSKHTADVGKALSGDEPSLAKTAGAVATEPAAVNDDGEGEESDTYDDFDHEENRDGDVSEDDEDEEEGDVAPPSKSNLTALLLGNPSVANDNREIDEDEDEEDDEDDEEDDGDFQVEGEDDNDDDDTYTAPISATNGKKRSIGDLHEHDDHGDQAQAKKARA
ncbi:hypothetical protein J3R30DRAFT_3531770 [Lentinula aciculospora]|uniref:Uncharacterized protein n=1 Tax=Lentinula aciculospora TaxID=153920 RepID=A0A9W9DHH2_9AGAR|nr:hypothetical protein J3R30DRAFT_3531770 [Lentinula aciculospora]